MSLCNANAVLTRYHVCLAALLSLLLSSRSFAQDASVRISPIDSIRLMLSKEWPTGRRSLVKNAELQVTLLKWFDGGESKFSATDFEAFAAMLRDAWIAKSDVQQSIELCKALPISKEAFRRSWYDCTITERGPEIRNRQTRGVVAGADGAAYDFCYSGNRDVAYFAKSKLIELYETESAWSRFNISDLVIAPEMSDGAALIEAQGGIIVRDADAAGHEDYFLPDGSRQFAWCKKYNKDDQLKWYRFTAKAVKFVGGDGASLLFPTLSGTVTFNSASFVDRFELVLVRAFRFNIELPVDAFKVAVPKGTQVSLFSGGSPSLDNKVGHLHTTKNVSSAVSLIPEVREKVRIEEERNRSRGDLASEAASGYSCSWHGCSSATF